ncbi:uncharacterized protein SPPG_04762 [Spizellomyces punctatus DAOM BR117]|uniref:CAP-Gly domain-containing protein n=1 Tax=Spizellomyces punctatus (strain DAOM BR117) TaxID=645134 RepID=A0A0L0HH51_SPIPD|nr:uncharacterized protein SPPG_04762 [Spizellomyces punctatus DAOM BR117]KND00443.1 hypothetical protein SPPG_04762 [Spizellomyces punctatus DAOM BR117]|eukprot:XP_016608482.1 hypothetical protein SPPG_04762 [Spizellomyces punctatus DAOM BR117]
MLVNTNSTPIVTVFVTSEGVSSERRFDKAITISKLKERLEPITGVPVSTMKVQLYTATDQLVGTLDDDEKMLGYYPVADYMRLEVIDLNQRRRKNEFHDVSQVEKFEISDAEYDKRNDSVRAFLQRNKMGKFAEKTDADRELEVQYKEEADKTKVGDRCEVEAEGDGLVKRGTVRFVGTVQFKPGYWVGVQYDEPLGKHDGTVQGVSYFTCPPKYGAFVRPNKVKVGDYPEDDLMDELDEM